MGRAGSGGVGGRSGGGHSSSRSSGGHRVNSSGSRRAGSRGTFGSGGFSRQPRRPRPPRLPRVSVHIGPSWGYRRRCYSGGISSGIISIIVLAVMIFFCIFSSIFTSRTNTAEVSTIERTKIENTSPFRNDCIVDELGWFENISKTERDLREFYDDTGIQPYIVLKDYDDSLSTDGEKEEWAQDYYDKNIDNETTMLYVYFAEENTDTDVGYMCYVLGKQANSVMDSEAIEIFWGQIDKYWYSDLSTDEVFIHAFNDTGNIIMKAQTNGWDVLKIVCAIAGAGLIIFGIVKIMKTKRQHEAEKAAETERILNTSLDELANETERKE